MRIAELTTPAEYKSAFAILRQMDYEKASYAFKKDLTRS